MPTYEFRCESGHSTDRFFRTINAAPAVIECPDCGASAVRQVSGGIGLVFRGSGFYITDYGKDGKKKPQSDGKSDSASESTGGAKTETSAASSDAGSGPGSGTKSSGSPKPEGGSSPGSTGSEK